MLGTSPCTGPDTPENMGLSTLPYDLLLNIASYLELRDVHALHLDFHPRFPSPHASVFQDGSPSLTSFLIQACKALHEFSTTRPVYRKLANDLLKRCRALPLKGFQRLADLSTEQLIRSVNKANRYETAWRVRAPRPITAGPYKEIEACRDGLSNGVVGKETGLASPKEKWYKTVSAPPGEEIDWLSPITSNYTLCATKSGKVVCWDVQTDKCLAEWVPGEKWELWKCRVEFEDRAVFFTMAKVLEGSYDDERVMEFVLMRLSFFDGPSGDTAPQPPIFSNVTDFRTTGVVMNVFLLDPAERLLSAFIWVSSSNTIGLYALLDWDKAEFVFIDTGIECVMSSNWSCILHEGNIVIHCEESDAAFQHFYPLSLLRIYTKALTGKHSKPTVVYRCSPNKTITKKFVFPLISGRNTPAFNSGTRLNPGVEAPHSQEHAPPSASTPYLPAANPFHFPPWYPESAHFVRQWWPMMPGVSRVSCTVVLLAAHDHITHRTQFVLAQHYFKVPLSHADWTQGSESDGETGRATPSDTPSNGHSEVNSRSRLASVATRDVQDDPLMQMWYVSTPFEVVRVFDTPLAEEDDEGLVERPRPLVAVDFGHAVWIEYCEGAEEDVLPDGDESDPKWLRFVTFPPFNDNEGRSQCKPDGMQGVVRTLEIPDELDLGIVETINIDQSQGAVILSDREGKIYILRYE